jgi:hypothetical protein
MLGRGPKWKPRAATDGFVWLEGSCHQKPLAWRLESKTVLMKRETWAREPKLRPKNISPRASRPKSVEVLLPFGFLRLRWVDGVLAASGLDGKAAD